jgi:hypothetical protein
MEIMYAELWNCGKCLLLQTIYSTHTTDDDRVHMLDEEDVTVSYSSSMMTASRRGLQQL